MSREGWGRDPGENARVWARRDEQDARARAAQGGGGGGSQNGGGWFGCALVLLGWTGGAAALGLAAARAKGWA